LAAHDWFFDGGAFGVRKTSPPEGVERTDVTSGTVLPHGWTADIAKAADNDAHAAGAEAHERDAHLPLSLRAILDTRQAQRPTSVREAEAWATIFRFAAAEDRRIVSGMPAVYRMAKKIIDDAHAKAGYPAAMTRFTADRRVAEEFAAASSFSAEVHVARNVSNANTAHNMMATYRIPWLWEGEDRAKRVLDRADRGRATHEFLEAASEAADWQVAAADADDDDMPDFFMEREMVGTHVVHVFPKCVVVKEASSSLVLGLSDWRKVIITVTGFKNYLAGFCSDASTGNVARVASASRGVSALYMNFREAVDLGAALPHGSHLEMAKMFKGFLAVVKARIAGERCTVHAAELLADLKSSTVYVAGKKAVDEALVRVASLPPRAAIAAAKYFRLLPPPDVWLAKALRDRWEKASLIHRVSDDAAKEFRGALVETILTAMAYDKTSSLELRDARVKPAWWDDYRARRLGKVPKSELAKYVRWEGTVKVADRSRYDPAVWKDSALGADSFDLAMSDDLNPDHKNMLTRLLFDKACPLPDTKAEWSEEISAVMLKPESHKERVAYMNHLASRFHQSACEATVSNVMRHHPSYAPVKTGVERDVAFDELSSPPPSVNDVIMPGKYAGSQWVTLYFSFDITGWSENMPINVQNESNSVWDEFTGTKMFSQTEANHHGVKVYMNNGGVKAWYENGGANFEGYNGKEMTALHVAIMTLSVTEMRRRLVGVPASMVRIQLQAYIDDGIAKMTVPSAIAEEVFQAMEAATTDTWAKFGFAIEAKKSFPSYYYFEFLGEEFYAGRQLASGTKAAMRITAEPFEMWESLQARCAKVAAACRGAATAGMDPPGAMVMQALFLAREIRKWVGPTDAAATAFWMLLPQNFDGLGCPALMQQSCNASGAAVEEGMATIRAWAEKGRNASVRKAYCSVARRGFASRTASEMLASPLGGSGESREMTANPLATAVTLALREERARGNLSSTASKLVSLHMPASQAEFANTVLQREPGAVYQEALLAGILDGTLAPISSAFTNRFEKEGTYTRLVGRWKLAKVVRHNLASARRAYASTKALVAP
jgi:hypothetical protein